MTVVSDNTNLLGLLDVPRPDLDKYCRRHARTGRACVLLRGHAHTCLPTPYRRATPRG